MLSALPLKRQPPSFPNRLYFSTPHPGKGTWIVNEFLNNLFGNEGGCLFNYNGKAESFPERANEHANLLLKAFIEQPIYAHYPWRTEWLDILADPGKAGASTLRANIMFCRGIPEEKSAGKTGVVGKWWMVLLRRQFGQTKPLRGHDVPTAYEDHPPPTSSSAVG
jgi:hypothetical protein